MQFTPQQMAGYKGYSRGVLIGNWSEDIQVQEDKLRAFHEVAQRTGNPAGVMTQAVPIAPAKNDGFLRFGSVLQVVNEATSGALAMDTTPRQRPKPNHAMVSLCASATPLARSTWVFRKVKDAASSNFDSKKESDIVHYGQLCRLVNEYASQDGFHSLTSEKLSAAVQSRGGKQLVSACLGGGNDANFIVEKALVNNPDAFEGQPVSVGDTVVIRHAMTRSPLYADQGSKLTSVSGAEVEVSAHLLKLSNTKVSIPQSPQNHWTFVTAAPGTRYTPFAGVMGAQTVLDRVKAKILQRAGGSGFRGIVRSLRLMDDDGSRTLSRREMKEGMQVYGVPLSTAELDHVFREFDRNGDGVISISEFLRTLRGTMNNRRLALVKEAFGCIDKDGSGITSFEEIKSAYGKGLSEHAQVKSGAKTEKEVLMEFIADWDRNGDASVTLDEFVEYYNDLSAGIDNDDYFELMIRNAWHMSGGEGWSANTSCKRVLVVHGDDTQEVVEVKNDLGVDYDDINSVKAILKKQGVVDIKRVELHH